MAYQKLQSREALLVIPNDFVRIPDPTSVVVLDLATRSQSSVGNFGSTTLTDTSGIDFEKLDIKAGMIVYNTTAQLAWYVVSVDGPTQLTIYGSVAGGAADTYSIYGAPTIGCTLFTGGAGDVNVRMAEQNGNTPTGATIPNQEITYKGMAAGSFMPIQVVQVYSRATTATDIIAMW